MSVALIRYSTDAASTPAWGAVRGSEVLPLPEELRDITDVLDRGVVVARELLGADDVAGVALDDVQPRNPLPGARLFCQGANYPSHMRESGMDLDRAYNMLFTKSTASLTDPDGDIVRPPHVRLLDYEVELGIVLRRSTTGPVTVTDDDLPEYVGAFVVANDVSARDVQLPQGQWYKGKSYPTFCPVGPYLCVPDLEEVARWKDLRLTLSVNGDHRQDALAGEMLFGPAQTITELSTLEHLRAGDLLLTGTPGGVALQPPKPAVQKLAALLPDAKRWELFVNAQAKSPSYLQPDDRILASISTDDGKLQLGTQHNTVR